MNPGQQQDFGKKPSNIEESEWAKLKFVWRKPNLDKCPKSAEALCVLAELLFLGRNNTI